MKAQSTTSNSRKINASSPRPVMEAFEPRLMLSGNTILVHDVDGDLVTVALSGPGTLESVTTNAGGIDAISFTATDPAASVLSIRVTRKSSGDGFVQVGSIKLDSAAPYADGLKSLAAPQADIVGDASGVGVQIKGYLASLSIHNLLNGADVIAQVPGGFAYPSIVKTAITANAIGDGSDIILSSHIGTMTVVSLGNGHLVTPSIGQLIVKDSCAANLDIARGVVSAKIAGQVSGTWNIGGSAGTVQIGSAANWSSTVAGSVQSLQCAGDLNLAGFQADSLGKLAVAGNMQGSFSLKANSPAALASASVAQLVSGTWNVAGGAGAITVGESTAWNASFGSSVASLICNYTFDFGTWTAPALGKLMVKGNMTSGTLNLTLPFDAKKIDLASATVMGWMGNTTIRSGGNIGGVTVGGMESSDILAGVKAAISAVTQSTAAADYFDSPAFIGSINFTGLLSLTGSFHDSNLLASHLGTFRLKNIALADTGSIFGLAYETLGSLTVQQGRISYNWPNKWPSVVMDFVVKQLA